MKTVNTPQGQVKLLSLPIELERVIRASLPFGAVRYQPPRQGAELGLVMQCGKREIYGAKQQPVDCDEHQSKVSYTANTILIAHSIASYLSQSFSGLFMPCAYIRTKEGGRFEAGITYFGFPDPQGNECLNHPFEAAYDCQFGQGFTTMMTSFIRSVQQSSRDTRIPLSPTIGLDIRSRSQIGSIGLGFMLVGTHVVCLKTVVSEQDPIWMALSATGVSEVFHIPSLPAAINEDDLHLSKSPPST